MARMFRRNVWISGPQRGCGAHLLPGALEEQAELQERAEKTVADAVKRAETIEAPEVSDIFNWTFAEIPEQIAKQRLNDVWRSSAFSSDRQSAASSCSPKGSRLERREPEKLRAWDSNARPS